MVDGFGITLDFYAQDSSAVSNSWGSIRCVRAGADNTSEMQFWVGRTGTLQKAFSVSATSTTTTVQATSLQMYASTTARLESSAGAFIATENSVTMIGGIMSICIDSAGIHIGDASSSIGFLGATPARPPTYTNGTHTTDRALQATASATLLDTSNVLSTLISDLRTMGLLG